MNTDQDAKNQEEQNQGANQGATTDQRNIVNPHGQSQETENQKTENIQNTESEQSTDETNKINDDEEIDNEDEEENEQRKQEKKQRSVHFKVDTDNYGRGKRNRTKTKSFSFLQAKFKDLKQEQRRDFLRHAWQQYKVGKARIC